MLHDVEVERHKVFGTTQRTTGVAALAGVYHAYNISADLTGCVL